MYIVTTKISKLFKMSVESEEVKGCFVPCKVTLNLLLFADTLTIFLELDFDFISYALYRSEEISPKEGKRGKYFENEKVMTDRQRDKQQLLLYTRPLRERELHLKYT